MPARWFLVPALFAALASGGCSSDDDVKPSPIPAGYALLLRQQQQRNAGGRTAVTTGGRTVDELLAVVDGEVLTRREILRGLRLTETEAQDPDVSEEIAGARLQWAQQRLIMGAARRAGMRIPESAIDDIARGELKRQMKANEEETGVVLSEDAYLRERKLTWVEFRKQLHGAVVSEYYVRKVYEGVGQARPAVDKGVDPSEVRRIYYDHRARFNEPRGVKLAIFQVPLEKYEAEGRDFLDTEQMADAEAARIRAALEARTPSKAIAERLRVDKANWQESPDFVVRFPEPDVNAWLLDEARRAGDARIFRDGRGPLVFGVVEVRPERVRTFDDPEVYDLIVRMLQGARRRRLTAQLTVDLLERGAVVWPPELADEMLDAAYEDLELVDEHEVVGKARLR